MSWMNSDGLYIKYGTEEADTLRGGHRQLSDGRHMLEFNLEYTDVLSATTAIIGSADADESGSFGLRLPEGAIIEAVEFLVRTAFTSSGTIGSSTLVIGTKKASDRSTELDHDGITTASFVGSVLDADGERTYLTKATTGAGAQVDVAIAENAVLCAANSAHASHPYTAGSVLIRIFYYFAS
jgi:hypothetical protein